LLRFSIDGSAAAALAALSAQQDLPAAAEPWHDWALAAKAPRTKEKTKKRSAFFMGDNDLRFNS
jgi:hypothetical protein